MALTNGREPVWVGSGEKNIMKTRVHWQSKDSSRGAVLSLHGGEHSNAIAQGMRRLG